MLRILITSIWTAANALLSPNENSANNPPSTSKWRAFGNFLISTLSTIGIPFVRSMTENDTLYQCLNTLLSNPTTATTTRNPNNQRQRPNSNLNRYSRTHFRRRSHHNGRIIRIIKPTIHVHVH